MVKKRLMILVFFSVVLTASTGSAAEMPRDNLLWDGFFLMGVEGKLIPAVLHHTSEKASDVNIPLEREPKLDWGRSEWSFEFNTDVNDLRAEAPAGTKLKLLPSSTLEKLIDDVNERSENVYMLSGWVTKYKGANFIFPNYFLPVSAIAEQQSPTDKEPNEISPSTTENKAEPKPVASEPNGELAMPKEILERLKTSRIVRPQAPRQKPQTKKIELERDTILTDRSAFLVKQNDGRLVFVLDAFGRNNKPVSFRLLPCEALELAELTQAAVPEPVRFKIAGIITKYKGDKYLLLQKATRIYSHGNFAR